MQNSVVSSEQGHTFLMEIMNFEESLFYFRPLIIINLRYMDIPRELPLLAAHTVRSVPRRFTIIITTHMC